MSDDRFKEIAEIILDFFSSDSLYWPNAPSSVTVPRKVTIVFDDTAREYEQPLLGHLERLLVSPQIHEYWEDGYGRAPLVMAKGDEKPDATIIFGKEVREGDIGLAYGLRFPDSEEFWPGWFNLSLE